MRTSSKILALLIGLWVAPSCAQTVSQPTCTISSGTITCPSGSLTPSGGSPGSPDNSIQYRVNGTTFGGISGWTTNGSTAITGAASTSLVIGGATIGTDALGVTGTATISGALTAGSFIPTSSSVPTNGMYLGAANQLNFASNSTGHWQMSSGGSFQASNTSGPRIVNAAASATVPPVAPNRTDPTTGIGAQAAGNVSIIAAGAEQARYSTAAASVATVLWPSTFFTGGTATTQFPALFVQPTGTAAVTSWSLSGTVFGVNAVSGFAGNFLDFHIAGATSLFTVNSGGSVASSGSLRAGTNINIAATSLLTGPTAGTWQLGNTDAASPVAQTLRAQSVVAGNANTAGTNWTFIGSLSNGTGGSAGGAGDMIFQTTASVAASGSQNAAVTALTLQSGTQRVIVASGKDLQLGSAFTTTPSVSTGYATIRLSDGLLYKINVCLASGC